MTEHCKHCGKPIRFAPGYKNEWHPGWVHIHHGDLYCNPDYNSHDFRQGEPTDQMSLEIP